MSIDISKIKPGDTVRVRYQTFTMQEAGVAPVEVETEAYLLHDHELIVMGWALPCRHVTVLSHTPKRPWADALVVRDEDGDPWGRYGGEWVELGGDGYRLSAADLEEAHGPITVVIDADGQVVT